MKSIKRESLPIIGCIVIFFASSFFGNVALSGLILLLILGLILLTKKDQFLLYRAHRAYDKGRIQESFTYYEKYIHTPKAQPLPKIVYSYRLLQNGQLDKAYGLLQALDFEHLSAIEKRNYNAAFALIHFKKGSCSRAIELYEDIFNEKPNQLGYETLGYLYLCGKRYDDALSFNKKAYEAYPDSADIKNNLACSYYYKDLYPEAAQLFDELMEMNTPLLEPYYYYALMLDEQGDYKEAVETLAAACDKPEIYLHQLKQEQIHAQLLLCQEHLKAASAK